MKIETETFILPEFWVCALINDDWTGLEDDDTAVLDAWLADHPGLYCVDVADDASFTKYHDATQYGVLACDAATFTFHRIAP